VFRFDTFGDEHVWTDTLHLNEFVEKHVDPTTALKVGLKVDADALPAGILDKVDLTSPATTVALLKMNAVIRVGDGRCRQSHHPTRLRPSGRPRRPRSSLTTSILDTTAAISGVRTGFRLPVESKNARTSIMLIRRFSSSTRVRLTSARASVWPDEVSTDACMRARAAVRSRAANATSARSASQFGSGFVMRVDDRHPTLA